MPATDAVHIELTDAASLQQVADLLHDCPFDPEDVQHCAAEGSLTILLWRPSSLVRRVRVLRGLMHRAQRAQIPVRLRIGKVLSAELGDFPIEVAMLTGLQYDETKGELLVQVMPGEGIRLRVSALEGHVRDVGPPEWGTKVGFSDIGEYGLGP